MADHNNDLIGIKSKKHKSDKIHKEIVLDKAKADDKAASNATDTESSVDSRYVNNWTDTNTNTLRTWKSSLRQALYVYKEVSGNLNKKLVRYRITNLIIGIFTTLIQSISTYALANFADLNNIYIALTISIITIIISAVTNFINGLMQIYKLNETVTAYTLYVERLDHLYSTIANQLTLPSKIREDAFTFIKSQNEIYLKLIKESPEIPSSDYKLAQESYRKYLKDESANMKFASSYLNNDTVIEVV